ncbi:MAG TPA: rod-binding protein [Xanthobacteraceae bacterium]|jgi:Rod binding domain-containing protein|nr:rod-binding protein [Xanthobacteraceae bacterium]
MTNIAASQLGLSLATLGSTQSTQAQAALGVKGKAKAAAGNFEAMFINSMFQQMFTGIDGDGPFGGKGALKVWRSFLTDQYAKTFAKSGGFGIAAHVYDQLLKQQGASSS